MAAVMSNAAPGSVPHPPTAKEFNTESLLDTLEHLRSTGKDEFPTELTVSETERTAMRHDEWKSLAEIPVIDLSQLQTDTAEVLRQIREAVTEWGFFQLVNHDLPLEVMRGAQAQGLKFFELPFEAKERAGTLEKSLERLGPYIGNNMKQSQSSLHWAESLFLTEKLLDKIVSQVWPEGNEEFRNAVADFYSGADAVGRVLFEMIAESLSLPTDFFAKHFKDKRGPGLRYNFYPACPRPTESMGAIPHTDASTLTLLLQDQAGGLQVKKGNEWIGIRPIEGALVVNVGDILHAWTNGICKSVLHRVVVSEEVHRLSLALFLSVDRNLPIAAPEELIDDGNPRKYKTLTPREYLTGSVGTRHGDKAFPKNGVVVLEENFKFEKQST